MMFRPLSEKQLPALSRRNLLQLGAGAATAWGLGSRLSTAATPITINQHVWTGAQEIVPQRIAKAYRVAHPDVQLTVTAGTSGTALNKIKATVQAGVEPAFNFGFFNMENTARGLLDNIWQPLDPALIPNLSNLQEKYRQPDNKGAFFCLDVGGIIYNKEKIKEPPKSWKDLFDPRYKGRIAMFDSFWTGNGFLATAFVNGGSEDNIEPAFSVYEEAAKDGHIHSLFTSNAQIQQLLVSGEVWLAPHFRGIALPWIEEGAPLGFAVPEEGLIAFPEGFQLVRGATPEAERIAQDVINQSLTREAIIDYSLTASVIPLLKDDELPPEITSDPAVQPDVLAKAFKPDYAKIAVNHQAWANDWNRRVKANLR